MEQKNYTGEHVHYDLMMNKHRKTGRLFGIIPFQFDYVKTSMLIIMAFPLLLISLLFTLNVFVAGSFILLFILMNSEYNRVSDLRDEVMTECIWSQVYFESDIDNGVPQLEDAPDHIDKFDVDAIFDEAIDKHKKTSFHIFERMLMKVKLVFD